VAPHIVVLNHMCKCLAWGENHLQSQMFVERCASLAACWEAHGTCQRAGGSCCPPATAGRPGPGHRPTACSACAIHRACGANHGQDTDAQRPAALPATAWGWGYEVTRPIWKQWSGLGDRTERISRGAVITLRRARPLILHAAGTQHDIRAIPGRRASWHTDTMYH
jgi:hypothetical protein